MNWNTKIKTEIYWKNLFAFVENCLDWECEYVFFPFSVIDAINNHFELQWNFLSHWRHNFTLLCALLVFFRFDADWGDNDLKYTIFFRIFLIVFLKSIELPINAYLRIIIISEQQQHHNQEQKLLVKWKFIVVCLFYCCHRPFSVPLYACMRSSGFMHVQMSRVVNIVKNMYWIWWHIKKNRNSKIKYQWKRGKKNMMTKPIDWNSYLAAAWLVHSSIRPPVRSSVHSSICRPIATLPSWRARKKTSTFNYKLLISLVCTIEEAYSIEVNRDSR